MPSEAVLACNVLNRMRDLGRPASYAIRRVTNRLGRDRCGPRPIHATRPTLAEMVGTTRSRVNFFMNKFRDLRFIEYNGDINVNRSLLTVVLHR